jgi:hypothetical protein
MFVKDRGWGKVALSSSYQINKPTRALTSALRYAGATWWLTITSAVDSRQLSSSPGPEGLRVDVSFTNPNRKKMFQ